MTRGEREIKFIEKNKVIHNNYYGYESVYYINNHTKVKISCPEHGIFEQQPNNHSQGNGCPKCFELNRSNNRKVPLQEMLDKANKTHDFFYDYTGIVDYKNTREKVDIGCPKHGVFKQSMSVHIANHGCPKCAIERNRRKQSKSKEELLEKIQKVHGNTYTHRFEDTISNSSNIYPTCKIHGEFRKSIKNYLKGQGCLRCSEKNRAEGRKDTLENVIERANEVHSHKWEYENSVYVDSSTKMEVTCKTHGSFLVTPNNHISKKSGCPKCVSVGPSKSEQEIYDFINDRIPTIQSDREVLEGKELDIYIPSKNLAIEYNGLYYHSDKFKDKKYHLNKTIDCQEKKIQLIHIFEDEWLLKKDIVESRLDNILGFTRNRIYARKTEVREVPTKEKSDFLDKNHLQGKVGSKVNLGLYYNEELVSIMTFGKLRKNMGQSHKEGHWELLRFCNKLNTNVIGGANKLLKYFENNYNLLEITSYADLRWSRGELYKRLNFEEVHISDPNYFYVTQSSPTVREQRYNYRKDILVSKGFDKNKTEKQIMSELKYFRIYDCGTLKFVKSYIQ